MNEMKKINTQSAVSIITIVKTNRRFCQSWVPAVPVHAKVDIFSVLRHCSKKPSAGQSDFFLLRSTCQRSSPNGDDAARAEGANNGLKALATDPTPREMRRPTQDYVDPTTTFLGVLVSTGNHPQVGPSVYQYAMVRDNVNLRDIFRVDPTFPDASDKPNPNPSTWQFNFCLEGDQCGNSIRLLTKSGIGFKKHGGEGIDPYEFAQLFTVHGVLPSGYLNPVKVEAV